MTSDYPPEICDYEGSNYRTDFWENKGRDYEDNVERIAIKRLMPMNGHCLLEVGAGFGRLSSMFSEYDLVVVMDYSQSQLEYARETLGDDGFLFVAANVYSMPFAPGIFDSATMIRVLHHMQDPRGALDAVRYALKEEGVFLLEYANKKNLKSILRYFLKKQDWNPFSITPIEFVELNYDFHPKFVAETLEEAGFNLKRSLTVSHFRMDFLKKTIPTSILTWLDSLAQLTGNWWQLSPSVFTLNIAKGSDISRPENAFWRCPVCGSFEMAEDNETIHCEHCLKRWQIKNGVYNFKEPI